MKNMIYKDTNLEKCINRACLDLGMTKDKIKYKIIEEKNSFFSKSVTIQILNYEVEENTNSGSVSVINGTIVVQDPKEGGNFATISKGSKMDIFVDNKKISGKVSVNKMNNIKVIFDEEEAERSLKIEISEDKMGAYITIKYKPKRIYTLKDFPNTSSAILETEILSEEFLNMYTFKEIKEELDKNMITYGIIDRNMDKCLLKEGVSNLLIAQGEKPIDDGDDSIQLKINVDKDMKNWVEEKDGRIDFKSIGFIESVKTGQVIAEKHIGIKGKDGINIFGNEVKHRNGKTIKIKAGEGCKIEENRVVALIDGKPCVKGSSFYVYRVHEVKGNVDLSTGNISFAGDIIIYGAVMEGMKVDAKNNIQVFNTVEKAQISALGNVMLKENVIQSKISAGGLDVTYSTLIESLSKLKENLKTMEDAILEIKKFNLLGDVTDGQTVKVLIENKFKQIPKHCFIAIEALDEERNKKEGILKELIKNKLIGMGPFNIKHFGELDEIIISIDENIETLSSALSLPVNVNLPYCQDTLINCSGEIVFTGKGEYISEISAQNVIFTQLGSVARGGTIKAKDTIKCKVVGSTGGVITKLQVSSWGNIYVEKAYQNTLFIVGERQYSLDHPSREIHAYLDNTGDIVVDKFVI